jgi:four helix bundle protein
MSYKKLRIWQLSREIVIDIYAMTMDLPKFELYETGSQIRRSSKSIRSNIVEGYGRRRYKQDFIRFLIYAHSSVDETRDHLEILFETKSYRMEKYLIIYPKNWI